MDFSWSEVQEGLCRRYQEKVRAELSPRIARRGAAALFTRDEWRLCGRIGLLGLAVPEPYGGQGLDLLTSARLVETFGHGCEDMGLVFAVAAHLFACALPIAEFAAGPFREEVLPKLCSGEGIAANAVTEEEAGSDLSSLKTTAVRAGDDYLLTGSKSWVTSGPVADLLVVYAQTNPAHGFLGLTAFAVERNTPGLLAGPAFDKMGLTSVPSSTLHFQECRIPASQRLGAEGQGRTVFNRSMQWERTGLYAGYLGMMQRQLEQTIERARQRRQFGKRLGKFQAVSHRIARMQFRLEAARLLLYRAAWHLDRGGDAMLPACLAKLAVSEAAVRSSLDALRVFGSAGYATANGIERGLRDALAGIIASGPSDIHWELIARELGL